MVALTPRLRRLARQAYERLPLPRYFKYQVISLMYRLGGPLGLFDGMAHYQEWKRNLDISFPALDVAGPVPAAHYADEVAGLRLATSEQPLVSVIIPAYGRLDQTLMCLLSIARHMPQAGIEVIVAEDASGDQDILRLDGVPGLRFISNPVNLGFLRSCNNAASHARGEYVFFLNNDTEVTAGWLDTLLELFARDPACALAGSKLVYPDGRLQEAGGIIWNDGGGMNYGRLDDPRRSPYNYVKESDYISGAAILLRTALFRELGGFDEYYLPAYYEDSDLAFRIRQRGGKVLYQPLSLVVHYEGVSHGTSTGSGIKAYQLSNQQKFRERWQAVLARENCAPSTDIFHARDRSRGKPTILVIDRYAPQPDKDAGSRSVWCIVRAFLHQGFNVKFWPRDLAWDAQYSVALQQLGVEVFYGAQYAGRFDQWLKEFGGQLDYVLVNRPDIAVDVIPSLRRHSKAKVLYYGHDLHYERLQRQHALTGQAELLAEAATVKKLEEKSWDTADVIYYPSSTETATVLAQRPGLRAHTLPLYFFDLDEGLAPPQPQQRHDLLFVAGFGHAPNSDGARWFVAEVMPLLWRELPGLRLTLAGSNPTAEVQALASDKITVTGYISDPALEALYAAARVAVVPLRFGAGVKGKVVEALKFQLPVVTTSVGLQGLPGLEEIIGAHDDAAAFADRVLALLRDEGLLARQVEQSWRYLEQHFSMAAMWSVFAQDVDKARKV